MKDYAINNKNLKIPKGYSEAVNWRQYDSQRKKNEKTSNDLPNTTHKTKDWAKQTPIKTRGELRCSWRVSKSCSSDTGHVTVKWHKHQM